jgi:outer membrane lipoprotein SlyB
MKRLLAIAASLMLALLVGCTTMGVASPDTFKKRQLAGYTTVEGVANTANQLRAAGKLSETDRHNVVTTARTAVAGLDVAGQVHKTDPAGGEKKLAATIAVLTALQTYLASQGADK